MKYQALLLTSLLFSSTVMADVLWEPGQGNAAHTGYVAITTNPANYHLVWTTDISPDDHGAPVIVPEPIVTNNKIYLTVDRASRDSLVMALDLTTGKILWQKKLPLPDNNGAALINNHLFVISSNPDKEKGILESYQADTGALNWSIHNFSYDVELLAYDKSLYAFAGDIASIDPVTGNALWVSVKHDYRVNETVTQGNYFYQLTPDLVAFNRLTVQVDFTIPVQHVSVLNLPQPYPVLDSMNNSVYYPFRNNDTGRYNLYALDIVSHAVKWVVPEIRNQVVLVDNDIYTITDQISDDNYSLICMNAITGQAQWSWTPDADDKLNPFTRPVATADVIFISGNKKTYAISRKTHQKIWEINLVGTLSLGDHQLFISHNEQLNKDVTISAIALM